MFIVKSHNEHVNLSEAGSERGDHPSSLIRTVMVAPLYTTDSGLLFHAGKILILTVGLPARGKTHISRALERYFRWMGVKTQVVSLGDYRRKTVGGAKQLPPDYFTLGAWRILSPN